jgi:hypothetical protein
MLTQKRGKMFGLAPTTGEGVDIRAAYAKDINESASEASGFRTVTYPQ